MLDRIRRKLFLSVKVMGGSDNPGSNENNNQLGRSEVMEILRKGSSALSQGGGMDLSQFLDATIAQILEFSREKGDARDAKIKQELKTEGDMDVEVDQKLLVDAEEEERVLLSGVAQVHSRLFEGQVVKSNNNKEIAKDWKELQKRARVNRLVMVNGIEVIADHIAPLVWLQFVILK